MLDYLLKWNSERLLDWFTKEKENILKSNIISIGKNEKIYSESDLQRMLIAEINKLVTNMIMQAKLEAAKQSGDDNEALRKIENAINKKTEKFLNHITYAIQRNSEENVISSFIKKVMSIKQ